MHEGGLAIHSLNSDINIEHSRLRGIYYGQANGAAIHAVNPS